MNVARPYHTPPQNASRRRLWDQLRARARDLTVSSARRRTTVLSRCRRGRLFMGMLGVIAALMALARLSPSAWFMHSAPASRQPLAAFPRVMLWAWERPESLDFIDPNAAGVAFLARTLYLGGADVVIRPRLQPLSVPPGTKLMAVVRIEVDRARPPDLSPPQRQSAAGAIAAAARFPDIAALQVDFDAALSQRPFYRDLLRDLRRQLPASMPLSITALASWCIYDDWLSGLPVDEVVPMVFRMGADQHRVRRYLGADDFRAAPCRRSLGIATDEPRPTLRPGRRLYVFHPHPWRADAMTSIFEEVGRWSQQP